MRIKGWMGRADQTTKVKGMFVRPETDRGGRQAPSGSGTPASRRYPRRRNRCDDAEGGMCSPPSEALRNDVARDTLRAVTKLGVAVELASLGSLPNDGKVIADQR